MNNANEDENAIDQPRWLKLLRYLVIALLCVSIIAMITVGWAAISLIKSATNSEIQTTPIAQNIDIPKDADPVSLTYLEDGSKIVIYKIDDEFFGKYMDKNDVIRAKIGFE